MQSTPAIDSATLIAAVHLWIGRGLSSFPHRDDSRLGLRFGEPQAERLLVVIKKLEQDFYATDAHLQTNNLVEIGRLAKAQFMQSHPQISPEVADALEWCYTYDFK